MLSGETSLAGDAEAAEAEGDAAKSPLQCSLSGSWGCEPFLHLPEPLPACSTGSPAWPAAHGVALPSHQEVGAQQAPLNTDTLQ